MAFLCPVRIRRGKKKKGGSTGDLEKEVVRSSPMGRITGSASIETLVRVGIEKENGLSPDSKMVVLHDFTPCVDDELEVKRGQVVNILYRENDWVYVIACESRQEGFIPHSYCTPFNSQLGELAMSNVKKKLPRTSTETNEEPIIDTRPGGTDTSDCESYGKKKSLPNNTSNNCPPAAVQKQHALNNITSSQASLHSAASSQPDVHPFFKDPSGRYIVLYTFIARDENDLSVERGEFVTVLNREDPDWYWVLRSDSQEGFVPSGFVYPADVVQSPVRQVNGEGQPTIVANQVNRTQTTGAPPAANQNNQHLPTATNPPVEEIRYQGTELVMLYDYKPQAPDDLSVRRGDWIYADLNNQTVDGWLWAYAPKTRKYGFIPKAYARPPAMTSL